MVSLKVQQIRTRLWQFLRDRMIIAPIRWTARALLRLTESDKPADPSSSPAWKQQVLEDFSSWLAALPEHPLENGQVSMDTCDLYTLLTAFTALRQEIKLQTRQQYKTLKLQEGLLGERQENLEVFRDRTRQLDQLEHSIRTTSELKTVLPFLDIRDALVRGLNAARTVASDRGIFRRPPKGLGGTVDGYQMALRRFDRALSMVGVTPIDTTDQPFDAACMRAVEKRRIPDKKPGIVVEEYMSGFRRGDEVIRPAEVVVNG